MSRGDFAYVASGALAVREEVFEACEETLGACCEFLRLEVEGDSWLALNVLCLSNCLVKSTIQRTPVVNILNISELVFHSKRLDMNVFKIPELIGSEIFTFSQSNVDTEFLFPEKYKALDLKGLEFDSVELV